MTKKQKPTSHRRSRKELVIDTFRYMIHHGEAVRKEVNYVTALGGYETKVIYKVEPNKR